MAKNNKKRNAKQQEENIRMVYFIECLVNTLKFVFERDDKTGYATKKIRSLSTKLSKLLIIEVEINVISFSDDPTKFYDFAIEMKSSNQSSVA